MRHVLIPLGWWNDNPTNTAHFHWSYGCFNPWYDLKLLTHINVNHPLFDSSTIWCSLNWHHLGILLIKSYAQVSAFGLYRLLICCWRSVHVLFKKNYFYDLGVRSYIVSHDSCNTNLWVNRSNRKGLEFLKRRTMGIEEQFLDLLRIFCFSFLQ